MKIERNSGSQETKIGEGPVRILLLSRSEDEVEFTVNDLPNIQVVKRQHSDLENMSNYIRSQDVPFTAVIDMTNTKLSSLGGHGVLYKVSLERALGSHVSQQAEEQSDEFSDWFSHQGNEPFIYLNPKHPDTSGNLLKLLNYFNGK